MQLECGHKAEDFTFTLDLSEFDARSRFEAKHNTRRDSHKTTKRISE